MAFEATNCKTCEKIFTPLSPNHCYCCKTCKRIWYRKNGGSESTERQYKLISGNWEKYFNRLCSRSFGREDLNYKDLVKLLEEQNYKCSLSGETLTCILEKGKINKTNASIDRIDPKGLYTIDNIHLVCAVLNKLRIDTPLDEFITWCKKVTEYHGIQK